jgi:hypothetical protein
LLWEASVKAEPQADDYGATLWRGPFRKTPRSRMSCRWHSFQSPAHIAKRQFVRWQAAKNDGASSRRVPVWRNFGLRRWPDSLLRHYRCKRSGRASESSARKTKCRNFRRLNSVLSRTPGRQCHRSQASFRRWPPNQHLLQTRERSSFNVLWKLRIGDEASPKLIKDDGFTGVFGHIEVPSKRSIALSSSYARYENRGQPLRFRPLSSSLVSGRMN